MAMEGISLDGAKRLDAALRNYYESFRTGGLGWNSSAMYGKNTNISKLMDEVIRFVLDQGQNGRNYITYYQNQLQSVMRLYSNFDNSGSSTLGQIGKS